MSCETLSSGLFIVSTYQHINISTYQHFNLSTYQPINSPTKYDYIISGTGCAGLSLAMHMIRSGKFSEKKILLVDQSPKIINDRTWCFWEQGDGIFESIVFRKWNELWFFNKDFERKLEIKPYTYKMIRGLDFYQYCLKEISAHPNYEICYEKVEGVFSDEHSTGIQLEKKSISSEYVFNSIIFKKPEIRSGEYWLLQHFKGWIIETEEQVFDPSAATIMDFRLSQKEGTAFCYLLPFSERKALVEFTVFSDSKFSDEKYNQGLKDYITDTLGIKNYQVVEEETGSIPMTNHKFSSSQGRVIQMGTAGGQTKGSSGYTFQFIQKHCNRIVEALQGEENPDIYDCSSRFHFYDSVLLNILHNNRLPGNEIFTDLFRKNTPHQVLRFLDNESSLADELKIISSLPTFPFLKAAFQQIRSKV